VGLLTAIGAAVLLAVDLGAAALSAALARRRGPRAGDALRSALLVALPVLGWVVALLWSGAGERDLGLDLALTAFAALATLVVGWLSGLVSLAGVIGRTGAVPDRGRRFVRPLALVLVPLALAGLVAREVTAARPVEAPAFETAAAPPFVLVGVDGLDADLVAELGSRGGLGSLLDGLERGSTWPYHRARPAAEPPERWTTVTTGLPAERHGVRGAAAESLPGVSTPLGQGRALPAPAAALEALLPTRTVPASAVGRRARTLWEISALGRSTAAVGWWSSWPAGPGTEGGPRSFVVTDRTLPKLLAGAAWDRDTEPESLYGRMAADLSEDREALRDAFAAAFAGVDDERLRALAWESWLIDGHAWRTFRRLWGEGRAAAGFVYLPGLDVLRHRLGPAGGTDAAAVFRIQGALEAYAALLDSILAEAVAIAPGARVVIVADPGRSAPRSEGFVGALGPGIPAACVGEPLGELAIAPTALQLLGFPAAAEMPGRPAEGCLASAPTRPGPVASYGERRPAAAGASSDWDAEMVERLRSLGYIR